MQQRSIEIGGADGPTTPEKVAVPLHCGNPAMLDKSPEEAETPEVL
jgi:hypothetical protein